MTKISGNVFFAPEFYISNGVKDISFYVQAFEAEENLCLRNDDGSVHVAELSINGSIFHIHEVTSSKFKSPSNSEGCTCCIGLFVDDVHQVFENSIKAGAQEIDPVTDHEYGYRQGTIKDPFGHYWQIQKKIL